MTEKTIEHIIESKKLPPDELDNFWENAFGFIPAILFLFAGLGPFLATKTSVNPTASWIVLSFGVFFLFYTIYAKAKERKLSLIQTNLGRIENDKLIGKIAEKEHWKRLTDNKEIYEFLFPFVRFHHGFKLTLIPIEKGILINFRNRGTIQARMPYQLGIETVKQKRIERKIINYAQQRLILHAAHSGHEDKKF
jgi:hypothetical protein